MSNLTTVKYRPNSFKLVLDERLQEFYEKHVIYDNPVMFLKAVAFLAYTSLLYYCLVFRSSSLLSSIFLGLLLSLGAVGMAFNIQHDGIHGGLSKYAWINCLAGGSLDILGASSYFWANKHKFSHHTYTNIPHRDQDIELGAIARLSYDQPWFWWHRYQHVYLWGLYGFVHLRYLYSDTQRIFFGKRDGLAAPFPKGLALCVLVLGKLSFLTLAFVIPLLRHSWYVVAGFYVGISMSMGIVLSVVFQMAHSVDNVDHPKEEDLGDLPEWTISQIQSTANFSTGNHFLTWVLGGLNFQREHHICPKVSHVHYPAIEKIVKTVCAEHGIQCRENRTLWLAMASHQRFLKKMGACPQ